MVTIIQIIQPDSSNQPTTPVAVKVLLEDIGASDKDMLDSIFGWFNRGSGSECPEFEAAPMRSLSEGDYVIQVCIEEDGVALTSVHRCDKIGWVDVLYEEMLDDISAKRNMPDWMKNNMSVEDFA